jgi:hypothetical protein
MQFRLSTLLLLCVVLWSSLAVFGVGGIAVFTFLVAVAVSIARASGVLFGVLILLLLFVLLARTVPENREHFRRASCNNNMKQLALALHNYYAANGRFPPAYIADKNGRRLHSWRVLILPYLEDQNGVYQRYNFNEPWDGPHNKKLLADRPGSFACPSDDRGSDLTATYTSYVAIVGNNAAWKGAKSTKRSDLKSAGKTILIIEATNANIPWTEPRDLDLDSLRTSRPNCAAPSSHHEPDSDFLCYLPPPGAHIALADGSVDFADGALLEPSKLPELLKVGGFHEEYTDRTWIASRRPFHWPNCLALAVWLTSVGLLLYRAMRSAKKCPASRATQTAGQTADQRAEEPQ